MKKWSIIITLTYFLFIVAFSFPLLSLFFNPRFLDFFTVEVIAVIVAVLILIGHFSLFGIQIKIKERRLVKKRGIVISIIVCSLLLTILLFFVYLGLSTSLFGDNMLPQATWDWIRESGLNDVFGWLIVSFWIIVWLIWGIIFWRYSKNHDTKKSFNRLISVLLAGSVAEMLIAIPSHIITRNRHDCCAPAFNLVGLGAGLAVFFLVMGPGVLYLYRKKIREKRNR